MKNHLSGFGMNFIESIKKSKYKTKSSDLYKSYIKRSLDVIFASGALVVLSPVLISTAFLVEKKLGTPVIYTQERPGLNEKIFKLYKFRTMSNETDDDGNLLPDEMRLNEFGRKLRSTSLDELPELINIIKGDMSFVGPRPLAVQYLPYYNKKEKRRHSVMPGLTGLAQINGRNATTWEERFLYDLKYVDNISFFMDVYILFETIRVVFKRDGIGTRGVDSPIDFDIYRKEQLKNGKKKGKNK